MRQVDRAVSVVGTVTPVELTANWNIFPSPLPIGVKFAVGGPFEICVFEPV
ncbi:MAG: hypothetical protein WB116_11900 [Candidatus Dormiibacterota bacterium]